MAQSERVSVEGSLSLSATVSLEVMGTMMMTVTFVTFVVNVVVAVVQVIVVVLAIVVVE